MADQFCRIVDVTLNNDSLGADAAEAIITTDSNTSYVIRDVYKNDSCTASNFRMALNIEMDGQILLDGLATSASGSVIIPPSSTVCVKDVSGNYPLKFECVYFSRLCDKSSFYFCNQTICTQCTVNTTSTGSTTTQAVDLSLYCGGICCYCCTSSIDYVSNGDYLIIHCDSDGNSDIAVVCLPTNTKVCCFNGGYCKSQMNNGVVSRWTSYYMLGMPLYDGVTSFTKCWCVYGNGSAPTTGSKMGIGVHPECNACVGYFFFPGGNCACPMSYGHVNLCCPTTIIPDNVTCENPTLAGSTSCFCSSLMSTTNGLTVGVFWSYCLNKFVPYITCNGSWIEFKTACGAFVKTTISCNFWCNAGGKPLFENKGRLYNGENSYSCQVVSVSLDDVMTNGANATICCHGTNLAAGETCLLSSYGTVRVSSYANTSALSCDFDIQPSTKFSAYGIKATTQG